MSTALPRLSSNSCSETTRAESAEVVGGRDGRPDPAAGLAALRSLDDSR